MVWDEAMTNNGALICLTKLCQEIAVKKVLVRMTKVQAFDSLDLGVCFSFKAVNRGASRSAFCYRSIVTSTYVAL